MPARASGGSAAQLNYVIAARDAQFQRVADRVTKRLERLERTGRKTTRSVNKFHQALTGLAAIKTLGGGLLAGFGITRFNRAITESIGRLDQLGKRARNIGITAEELQLWSQAAKEAGVQTNSFQRGLLRFNRVFAEAAEGMGEYVDIFNRVGVSIRSGRGELRPLQEVLKEVTERFGDMSLAAQQLTAEELFGRGGKEMRAFLADFQNQVAGVAKEFKSASSESVALAEQLQNMRDRAGGQLTAALDEMLVRLDRWLGVTQALVGAQNALADAARGVSAAIPEQGQGFRDFRTSTYGGGFDTGRFADPSGRGRSRAERRGGFGNRARFTTTPGGQQGGPLVVEITGGRSGDRFHPGNLPAHLRHRPEASESPDIERLGFRLSSAMRRREQRIAAEREQRLERIAGINKRIEEARYAAAAQFADLQRRQEMERARMAMRAAEEQQRQLARVQQRLGSVISDFITGTGTIGDRLRGLLDTISGSIIDSFANRIAGSLLSGAGGGFLSGLFGFQRGGAVQRGRAILVGEGGPEVFVPRTSGQIIPNQVAAAPGRGPTINLTFNIESTDGPGVRAALREAEPRLTGAALMAVAQQQSRPGSALGRQNRLAP